MVAGLVDICRAAGGVTAVNADIERANIASQRVLERNGFQRIREMHDLAYFTLRLGIVCRAGQPA